MTATKIRKRKKKRKKNRFEDGDVQTLCFAPEDAAAAAAEAVAGVALVGTAASLVLQTSQKTAI